MYHVKQLNILNMKAVIYVRVSTKGQDYQRQITDLQTVAKSKSWEVIDVITEKASGVNKRRQGLDRLMSTIESGAVQKLLVTEISRLGRRTLEVLTLVDRITEAGVSIYIHNYGVETIQPNGKKNPMVSMMLTILSEFATMERENTIDRIHSGLAHAKKKGKVLGRPTGTVKDTEALVTEYKGVVRSLRKGLSIREAAKVNDVAIGTVMKVKKSI